MKNKYLLTLLYLTTFTCFAQWSQVNNGISNLSTGARLIGSTNTDIFAVSIASGVYKTNDNGNNWTQVNTPIGFTSPPKCGYYFNGNYFVGLDNSTNCIYYTSDSGENWTSGNGSPASTVVKGFLGLSSTLFAYTSSKGVYRSTDGGVSWNEINTGLTNLKIASMTSINSKIVLATEGAGIFISSDNGDNWVQSNSGMTGSLNGTFVWTMGDKLYYHSLVFNGYYSSSNEGVKWSSTSLPVFSQNSAPGTKSLKEVYRSGNNLYMIVKTQNGLSINDSVYSTKNEGTSWANITGDLPNDVLGSGLTEFGDAIFIAYGSANLGIYKRSIDTSLGLKVEDLSELVGMYPNPFQDKIYLSNSSNNSIKQIFLYDNLGKTIKIELIDNQYIATSDLSEGVYLIEIQFTDDSIFKRKLVKSLN